MSATTINSLEFCRVAEQASGTTAVAEFVRLRADLHDASGELSWAFQGGRHSEGLPQLSLTVKGEVRLVCQRCLTPFTQQINAESRLVLVADEAQAEATEERLDDESIDVIVGSTAMDLLAVAGGEARKVYASHATLWALLDHCSRLGLRDYDLSGVDPVGNKGVFDFKHGTGASLVECLGEWEWASLPGLCQAVNWLVARKGT